MLMVLVQHSAVGMLPMLPSDPEAFAEIEPWTRVFDCGMFGVDIFFVMSGFLVSSMIFKETAHSQKFDFYRFWMRRGLKVWPSYYLVYGAWALLYSASILNKQGFGGVQDYWQGAWVNLVFLQNYVNTETRWFASWSLAVEEHFYLALPIIVVAVSRWIRTSTWLPLACIGGIALCYVLRLEAAADGRYLEIWRQTHFRMDSLMSGVILGYIYVLRPAIWARLQKRRVWCAGFALAIMAVVFSQIRNLEFIYSSGLSLVCLAGMGFVIYFFKVPNETVDRSRVLSVLRHVGLYSFPIYTAQIFGWSAYSHFGWTKGTFLEHSPIALISFWVISISIGVVVHRVIENPVLRLRDRLLPSRAASIS